MAEASLRFVRRLKIFMPDDLPAGLRVNDLEDDLHFVSSEEEAYERELEKADAKHDDDL